MALSSQDASAFLMTMTLASWQPHRRSRRDTVSSLAPVVEVQHDVGELHHAVRLGLALQAGRQLLRVVRLDPRHFPQPHRHVQLRLGSGLADVIAARRSGLGCCQRLHGVAQRVEEALALRRVRGHAQRQLLRRSAGDGALSPTRLRAAIAHAGQRDVVVLLAAVVQGRGGAHGLRRVVFAVRRDALLLRRAHLVPEGAALSLSCWRAVLRQRGRRRIRQKRRVALAALWRRIVVGHAALEGDGSAARWNPRLYLDVRRSEHARGRRSGRAAAPEPQAS
eukprot:scaffold6879_cov202-Pinguiococcus_pyrenoidosus.AAC.5